MACIRLSGWPWWLVAVTYRPAGSSLVLTASSPSTGSAIGTPASRCIGPGMLITLYLKKTGPTGSMPRWPSQANTSPNRSAMTSNLSTWTVSSLTYAYGWAARSSTRCCPDSVRYCPDSVLMVSATAPGAETHRPRRGLWSRVQQQTRDQLPVRHRCVPLDSDETVPQLDRADRRGPSDELGNGEVLPEPALGPPLRRERSASAPRSRRSAGGAPRSAPRRCARPPRTPSTRRGTVR